MEDWIEPGENIDPDDCMECIDTFMGQLLRVCHIMEDIPPDAKGVLEVIACAIDFESIAREIEAINNGMEVGSDKVMDISAQVATRSQKRNEGAKGQTDTKWSCKECCSEDCAGVGFLEQVTVRYARTNKDGSKDLNGMCCKPCYQVALDVGYVLMKGGQEENVQEAQSTGSRE